MSETKRAIEDWRTLEAGDELDRIVAERLGWKIAPSGIDWNVIDPTGDSWYLCSPDDYPAIDDAWDKAIGEDIPRYSRDANAALYLVRAGWQITRLPDGWHVSPDYPNCTNYSCSELPEAIVRVFLADQDRMAKHD